MARKSILKRVKFTRTGKMLRRRAGQNHFNAKQSRRAQRRQSGMTTFSRGMKKRIQAHL